MVKKSGSGSGMNNPAHIYESLETIYFGLKYLNLLKYLKYFDADPGSEMEKIRIRDKHPGSTTLSIRFSLFRIS
jgi:hypothetical protein